MLKASVIIPCAGSGTRMQKSTGQVNGQSKIFITLANRSVIQHTVRAFYDNEQIMQIILACKKQDEPLLREQLAGYEQKTIFCEGGATRCETVYKALKKTSDEYPVVLIHDAVRPFVTQDLINGCIRQCERLGSAITAVQAKDTIKKCAGSRISETLNRDELYQVQTPQTFLRSEILDAYDRTDWENATDDAQLYERAGYTAYILQGDYKNIKLTTAEDLIMANAFLNEPVSLSSLRIGTGFDVHAFAAGRKLILGGVEIPSDKGLAGHSDADVLTHAIMDALLGAAGQRDIGTYFPDTDQTYKDINSQLLLSRVKGLLEERGFEIINIDSTVIAQEPKLSPYISAMCLQLSQTLGLLAEQVNIKATTTEKLGFTGRKEGIAAQSSVLMQKRNS